MALSKYETFPAQMDDYLINILDISNTNSMALHKHEFILTDGAVIENMGRHAQEIKFRTYWFGSNIESYTYASPTYANHFLFLASIEDSTVVHTLQHPKYGEIKGYIESYTVINDDTQLYATIDIQFVEDGLQNQNNLVTNALNLSSLQVDMLNDQLVKIGSEIQANGFTTLLGQTVDFSQKMNTQFTNLTTPCRNFLKECDTVVGQMDKFLSNITQPLVTVDSLVSYASDVPSRILSSMNQAANRIVGSLSHLSNLPVQFLNNMIVQTMNLKNTITGVHASFFQAHLLTVCAGSIAVQTGILMEADNNSRQSSLKLETTKTFDVSGNRVNSVTIPVLLSQEQVDAMIFSVRDFIQINIIDVDRDQQQLKNMVSLLTGYINNTTLKKQQQVKMTVSNIPIHLLCMQLGIPYNGANRIYALNPG